MRRAGFSLGLRDREIGDGRMKKKCDCTRFFTDCDEAAGIFDQALQAYLDDREAWGRTMWIYYLWHKRRVGEVITFETA